MNDAPLADAEMADVLHVVAGVLIDTRGRVLLAQRPPGKHLAGMWEFPGGKCEEGESVAQALARELREELGIEAEPGAWMMCVPWCYGHRRLRLDVLSVPRWLGSPAACEGQVLRWSDPHTTVGEHLAPADRLILQKVCETDP